MRVYLFLLLIIVILFNCSRDHIASDDCCGGGCDVGTSAISGKLYAEDTTIIDYPVTVKLYKGHAASALSFVNGIAKTALQSDTLMKSQSTENGGYRFDSLTAGDYQVVVLNDDIVICVTNDFPLSKDEKVEDTLYVKEVITLFIIIDSCFSKDIVIDNSLIDNNKVVKSNSGYIVKTIKEAEFSFNMVVQKDYVIDTIEVKTVIADNNTVRFTISDTTFNGLIDTITPLPLQKTNTLFRIVPEPAGSNCQAGGRIVETGLDINNNNTLDDDEVTDTSYICNEVQVLEGDYTVNSQEDLEGMVYTEITGNLTINAPDIENVDSFRSLTSVGGALYIDGNAKLTNIDGLNNLAYVGGNLRISGNAALTNLDGLSNITYGGGITFTVGTAGPQGLAGSHLVHDSSLVIDNNIALTNIDGLSGITHVGGDLRIRSNAALINVEGISNLSSVNGDLEIDSNTALTDLDGLNSLASVNGNLLIKNNTALITIDGLSSIDSIDDLTVFGNASLTNIDGLSGILTVGGKLEIQRNIALKDLDGLSGVTFIGGNLDIDTNASLTNLNGLSSITSIGGELYIAGNQTLASMTGLSGLSTLGGDYIVRDNIVLPACQARNIADNLINILGYTRTITISGNDDTGTCPTFMKTYGGSDMDYGNSGWQTTDGGFIIGGVTGSFGSGGLDGYLIKTNNNGDTLWTLTYGDANLQTQSSVRQTSDKGFIMAGHWYLSDRDPDFYLAKTDSSGRRDWYKTYPPPDALLPYNGDYEGDVIQTSDGGYLVSGSSWSYGSNYSHLFLVKTKPNGDLDWTKILLYGSNTFNFGKSIQQTADGGYIVCGCTAPRYDDSCDVLLMKFNANNDSLWSRKFGESADEKGYCVQPTSDGYIIVGKSGSAAWLIKTDNGGNILREKKFDNSVGNYVQTTSDGGFVFVGTKGTGEASDIVLLKTDASLNQSWQETYGGTSEDVGNCVQQTIDGGYIITGTTKSFGAGGYDVLLIKTDINGKID